jgi:hypothetical protein
VVPGKVLELHSAGIKLPRIQSSRQSEIGVISTNNERKFIRGNQYQSNDYMAGI